MAITQSTTTLSQTLLPEYASRNTLLTRTVTDNGNGTVSTTFGVTVHPQLINYIVDANSNPIGISNPVVDLPSFDLTPSQLTAIYGLQVTPAGATAAMSLGDVIANAIDQTIAATGVTGTINTPSVTLPTAS